MSRACPKGVKVHLPVRNFTWGDLPAVLDFVEGVRSGGALGREMRQRVFQEVLAQPGLAPQLNCFLLEEDGQLRGFCRVSPELAIGRTVVDLEISPRLAGDAAEKQLIQRAVARSGELGARVVHWCVPKQSPRGRLLEEEGFSPTRTYWDMLWSGMEERDTSPLPPAVIPRGFSIRHFQHGDTHALTEVQNAAFAGSWGFCPNTVEQIQYRSSMSNTRPEGILFLRHGERIAGYCWTTSAPTNGQTRGSIAMIGVLPDYRGRGVSRAILLAGMTYLGSVGAGEIGLQVDESNTPAIGLYDSVGFDKVAELQWFQLRLAPS